jgi:hypothetical protein
MISLSRAKPCRFVFLIYKIYIWPLLIGQIPDSRHRAQIKDIMSQPTDGEAKRGIVKPQTPARGYRPQGKNYLLVVGIDEYQHCPRLYNAVKDARDVAATLVSGYQFSKDHLMELYNGEATQSEIIKKFRFLAKNLGADDALLVYFSGHGEYDETIDTGYWIPVDGRLGEIRQSHQFPSHVHHRRFLLLRFHLFRAQFFPGDGSPREHSLALGADGGPQ